MNRNDKELEKDDRLSGNTEKTLFTIIFVLIAIILCLLFYLIGARCKCTPMQMTPQQVTVAESPVPTPVTGGGYDLSSTDDVTSPKAESKNINISGFSELYIGKGQYVPLQNPEENTATLMFRIYDEDTLIFESAAIAPGKEDRWYAAEDLEKGNYNLKFIVCKVLPGGETANKLNFKAMIHITD